MSANGEGPNLENLRKLRSQLKSMAKVARSSSRRLLKRNGSAGVKLPRQSCSICGSVFDFVESKQAIVPEMSRCAECKQKLASGLTAIVGKPKIAGQWLHAFVRSSKLKPGAVYFGLSDEVMAKVQSAFQSQQNHE